MPFLIDTEVIVLFKSDTNVLDCTPQTAFEPLSFYVSSQLNHVPVPHLIIVTFQTGTNNTTAVAVTENPAS